MSVAGNKARIATATRELAVRWQEAQQHWRDVKSQEFDQRYMQELFARTGNVLEAVEKLEELVKKIRKECE